MEAGSGGDANGVAGVGRGSFVPVVQATSRVTHDVGLGTHYSSRISAASILIATMSDYLVERPPQLRAAIGRKPAANYSLQELIAALDSGSAVIACEVPSLEGGATAAAHLAVVGWTCCRTGIAEVTVTVGGRRLEPRRGFPRADLQRLLSVAPEELTTFAIVLDLANCQPGVHELRIEVRGRAGESTAVWGPVEVGPDVSYRAWRRLRDSSACVGSASTDGSLIIHVLGDAPSATVVRSLVEQTFGQWRMSRGSLAGALQATATGTVPIVLIEGDGALAPDTLARLATAMNSDSALDLAYGDEDAIVPDGGRGDAFLKPGWSPELLLEIDYVGPLLALSPRACALALLDTCPASSIYEVLIALLDAALNVRRIPDVLFTSARARVPSDSPAVRAALTRLATRRGRSAVIASGEQPGTRRVSWMISDPPLVSVIVPTGRSHAMLARCLDSLSERTTYPEVEVVLVDSSPPELRSHPEPPRRFAHRVVPYTGRFNFSTAVNLGAASANGEILVLLNDDTEIMASDWIERMLDQLLNPGVAHRRSKVCSSPTIQSSTRALSSTSKPPAPTTCSLRYRTMRRGTGGCYGSSVTAPPLPAHA